MQVQESPRNSNVGMDHFADTGSKLERAQDDGSLHRNFQGYSTHAGAALLGFGTSAIGGFEARTEAGTTSVYAQNPKNLAVYYRALDAGHLPTERGYMLTDEDRLRRHVIERLLCDFELDFGAVEADFGTEAHTHLAGAFAGLQTLEALGVVRIEPGGLLVTERGRPFVRNVAMAFDAYLAPPAEPPSREREPAPRTVPRPRYSQTV